MYLKLFFQLIDEVFNHERCSVMIHLSCVQAFWFWGRNDLIIEAFNLSHIIAKLISPKGNIQAVDKLRNRSENKWNHVFVWAIKAFFFVKVKCAEPHIFQNIRDVVLR